ncbi:acetylornithine deacetylase [Vreelandella neptunia]|uniref:Acetylornithine deacetylase n=1 Tax=Vreelandella neptunia TaxID=115551 RepID=A0ABZ0YLW2_9GAMM|nr:acetylornithine deacetylase [Halomonas neptunia]MDN3560811.1 acetylornithine deacetylase [Halomonas neptunia]TDV97471.1 acetylornithine deacetylase [Halomonas alkaliantarctica]WQH13123.1 acetylornithine deacetylase [Halomonas neptunia]
MTEATTLLAKLVSFDTTSSESNLALIEYVEGYLAEYGVSAERVMSPCGTKANLIARIGSEAPGGVMLSGHTDVVPVAGQPWSSDPFTLRDGGDGRLYGRGTCDMKGFIACVLAMVPKWVEAPLQQPIYLGFSYDEEIGCVGAPSLIKRFYEHYSTTAHVIVGEPTSMQPVVAQKGATNLRTTVIGQEAHSSQVNQGTSAIHVAARLVTFIEDTMAALVEEGRVDEAFNVPHTSLHVGKIKGGTAINIMARECQFEWEIRHLPTDTFDEIYARFEAYCGQLSAELQAKGKHVEIITEPLNVTVPGLADRENEQVLRLAKDHLPTGCCDHAVAYATEAGQFQGQGLQTIILGPGSIAQAHQPDEYIDIEQLEACEEFLMKMGKALEKTV